MSKGRKLEFDPEIPPNWFYTDVDAEEDAVLFPEETLGQTVTEINGDDIDLIILKLMSKGLVMKRTILDPETDENSDDYEGPSRPISPRLTKIAENGCSEEEELDLLEFPDPHSLDCECEACLHYGDRCMKDFERWQQQQIDRTSDDEASIDFDDLEEFTGDKSLVPNSKPSPSARAPKTAIPPQISNPVSTAKRQRFSSSSGMRRILSRWRESGIGRCRNL